MNWDRDPLPLLDSLRVVTRDVAPVVGSLNEGEGLGYVALDEEERIPESLQGALREIRKLKEFVKEIKHATHYFGGIVHMSHVVHRNSEDISKLYDYSFKAPQNNQLLTNPTALAIFAHERIDSLTKDLSDQVAGLWNGINSHAQATAGVHGAPDGGAVAWTDQPDEAQVGAGKLPRKK